MRSANEIAAMVLKAARGAGMALGCAEELSRAAPNLIAAGALGQVPDLLEHPFDAPKYQNNKISDGHPVQALIAWRDFKAAGQDVQLDCTVSQELQKAMTSDTSPAGPFEVDAELWDVLQAYANRILVPETEASRLSGAGAGLTDND